MREIRFRGKSIKTGKWIYGNLVINKQIQKYQIIDETLYGKEVEKETIGQYAGLHDKNEREIYEGDIVDIDNDVALTFGVKKRGKIQYIGGMFLVSDGRNVSIMQSLFILADTNYNLRGEVIGNIYNNKNLLESE